MPTSIQNHVYPKTVEEALAYLKQPATKVLAGGTAVSLSRDSSIETLVDLQGLNLSYIRDEGASFKIGAMTSAYDIYIHPDLPQCLRTSARKIGDPALLCAVTIGGNVAELFPWVDLAPMLFSLGASFTLYNPEKGTPETLNADEFFALASERNISVRRYLITEVDVPKPPTNSYGDFRILALTETEKGQLNFASYLEWGEDGVVTKARLVVSSATPHPTRLQEVEQLLVGKKLTSELINEVGKEPAKGLRIIPNYKSSVEYRQEILGVYLKRALHGCLDRMEK